MKTVTVVYNVVDEAEWAKRNPLHYAHDGLKAVRVGIGDALDARDALTELLPFVEEDYHPNCATPEFKGAMIHALRCTANAPVRRGTPSPQVVGSAVCEETTTARTDASDNGKWRRCELPAGHSGDHKTTYCGRDYCWPNAANQPDRGSAIG